MDEVNPPDLPDDEERKSDTRDSGLSEDSDDLTRGEDSGSADDIEYEQGETIFQFRVLYGLGKCADLVFPRSVNKPEYRAKPLAKQQV